MSTIIQSFTVNSLWITGAQIGSILGPTLATQAEYVGIVSLYLLGSAVMFMMVTAMYFYVDKFGVPLKSDADSKDESKKKKSGKSEEGVRVLAGQCRSHW